MHVVLRLLLSALLLCWLVPVLYGPTFITTLPLSIERDAAHGYVIAKHPDLPLPDGLHAGDVVDLSRMGIADRIAALQIGNSPAGLVVNIAVRRGDEAATVAVTAVPDTTRSGHLAAVSGYPVALSLIALALITLWLGRNWTAWGLLLFASTTCIHNLLLSIPLDPVIGLAASLFGTLLGSAGIAGLYVTADALAGDGLTRKTREGFRTLLVACCVANVVGTFVRVWWVYGRGEVAAAVWARVVNGSLLLVIALSVSLLALGYRKSSEAQKLRIRWVLSSTSLLLLTVCLQLLSPKVGDSAALALVYGLLITLSMGGYLYAVLRHRLVDVSFIIDRTIVYGTTTVLVVAVFSLIEKLVESLALGKDASVSLQAGVTLVIALVINRVHHRVEHAVSGYIFRRQHLAIAALRRFARECSYVEKYPRLLQLCVACVQEAIGGAGVAIYERRSDGFDCRIHVGNADYPRSLDVDDPVLVAMRATRHWVETPQGNGRLTAEGYAFPIMLRERMIGILLCGARHQEKLAPDELEALETLARELARASYDIRMREYEHFLSSLAADEVSDPRGQAQRLSQSGYALVPE